MAKYTLTKGSDTILVELLPNGKFKVETPGISSANHLSATQFLAFLESEGCELESKVSTRQHHHHHSHSHSDHEHEH